MCFLSCAQCPQVVDESGLVGPITVTLLHTKDLLTRDKRMKILTFCLN